VWRLVGVEGGGERGEGLHCDADEGEDDLEGVSTAWMVGVRIMQYQRVEYQ